MYNFSRNVVRVGRALASASRAASTSSTSTSAPAAAVAATNASGTSLPATKQSPNYPQPWSTNQQSRAVAYQDARFEQTNLEFQPQPLSAMELIAQEPVRMVNGRIAVCDGGKSNDPACSLVTLPGVSLCWFLKIFWDTSIFASFFPQSSIINLAC